MRRKVQRYKKELQYVRNSGKSTLASTRTYPTLSSARGASWLLITRPQPVPLIHTPPCSILVLLSAGAAMDARQRARPRTSLSPRVRPYRPRNSNPNQRYCQPLYEQPCRNQRYCRPLHEQPCPNQRYYQPSHEQPSAKQRWRPSREQPNPNKRR